MRRLLVVNPVQLGPHAHAGTMHPVPARYPNPSTPYGYGGGYLPSGGYPPQPGGPCATTSTHAAPPMWRNVDEDFDRVAKEMADANNQWKRLDDHPQLMDPSNKPPDSNGNPYIPGAAMFVSTTINAGSIFIGSGDQVIR